MLNTFSYPTFRILLIISMRITDKGERTQSNANGKRDNLDSMNS